MNHLSPADFVECAEGTPTAAHRRHLDSCDACRAQVARLRDSVQRFGPVNSAVPEPSPLYWEHLSSRIREEVALAEPRAPWVPIRALVPALVALAIVIAVFNGRVEGPAVNAPLASVPAHADLDFGSDSPVEPANADVWAVLTAAASDMAIDDARAAGLGVRSAAIDHAVQRLNPEELAELGRLLQSELKGSGD